MPENIKIGFIIPTLGTRDTLFKTILSIQECKLTHEIIIVKPHDSELESKVLNLIDKRVIVLDQQSPGLVRAINIGLSHLNECNYWNWCGDDDEISATGMENLAIELSATNSLWGSGQGLVAFDGLNLTKKVKLTQFKLSLQKFGPNLIPQPPILFSLPFTRKLNGVNEKYSLAFDQELIQQFLKNSPPLVIDEITGRYSWHSNTLSNKFRRISQRESLRIRIDNSKNPGAKMFVYSLFPLSTLFIWTAHLTIKLSASLNKKIDTRKGF